MARVLGVTGRTLMWAGAIVLAFVAYQLWGTNLAEARAQDDLESEFEERLAGTAAVTTTTTIAQATDDPPAEAAATTTTVPPPPPDDGEAVARMVIPAIGVDKIVVEGVGRSDLEKGPGHYPGTPMPGQPGNAAIAGHRTTYGAPFQRVDRLEPGDEILVTTLQGSFTYEVSGLQIVSPADVEVVEDQGDDRLTLTSCHPKYSAAKRIIVTAMLVDEPAPAPAPPDPVDETEEADEPEGPVPAEGAGPVDGEPPAGGQRLESLDAGAETSAGPAVAWGAVALAVWLAIFVVSRRWRRWPAYLLGAPVFLVALFVFFEAFAQLLPANY